MLEDAASVIRELIFSRVDLLHGIDADRLNEELVTIAGRARLKIREREGSSPA